MDKESLMIFGAILTAVISIIGGVVTLVIQGFFKDSRTMNDASYNSLKNELQIERLRINRLDDKFEKVLHSYGDVFNKLLEKFSSWEDRIKKVMDEYGKLSPSQGTTVATPEKIDAVNVLMKKEIRSIADDVQNIENELKTLNQDLNLLDSKQENFSEAVNNFRRTLTRLMSDLAAIKGLTEKNATITADKIDMLFKIFKSFNNDQKKLVKRIEEIAELSKNRIKLIE